jgi:hypothetical protein
VDGKPIVLRDAEADLNAEFRGYGIKRPPNEYGFFSQEEINRLKTEQRRQSGAGAEM